ncbi:MAG TPA: hypothetical protein VIK19_07480 [Syntrophales bacterium]|jgi:hypothetical protein
MVSTFAPAALAPFAICVAKMALFPFFRGLPRSTTTFGTLSSFAIATSPSDTQQKKSDRSVG